MDMLAVIAPIAAVGALYVVAPVAADAYRRFRGSKTVTCPETMTSEQIQLDAMHAAIGEALARRDLRVMRCSRWNERHYCGHECVAQIR